MILKINYHKMKHLISYPYHHYIYWLHHSDIIHRTYWSGHDEIRLRVKVTAEDVVSVTSERLETLALETEEETKQVQNYVNCDSAEDNNLL